MPYLLTNHFQNKYPKCVVACLLDDSYTQAVLPRIHIFIQKEISKNLGFLKENKEYVKHEYHVDNHVQVRV